MKKIIKRCFETITSKTYWNSLLVSGNFFWGVSASLIIFILMIPAVKSGDVHIWMAITSSIMMGSVASLLSNTYDNVNPIRGIFRKRKKHE